MSNLQRKEFNSLLKNFESEELEERLEFEKAWYCDITVCHSNGYTEECRRTC